MNDENNKLSNQLTEINTLNFLQQLVNYACKNVAIENATIRYHNILHSMKLGSVLLMQRNIS